MDLLIFYMLALRAGLALWGQKCLHPELVASCSQEDLVQMVEQLQRVQTAVPERVPERLPVFQA
jgi:hypothetical protein